MTKVLRLAFLLMEAAASGFLAPALLERMDRGFDRSLLAARWSAAFVEAICQGPGPTRCPHIGEHNSSYNAAFADHVVDLLKSYSRRLEQKVGHFPSSLASRLTAGRSERKLFSAAFT